MLEANHTRTNYHPLLYTYNYFGPGHPPPPHILWLFLWLHCTYLCGYIVLIFVVTLHLVMRSYIVEELSSVANIVQKMSMKNLSRWRALCFCP